MTSRKLIIEADGGSRGNPGPAGYGALVRDAETGRVLAERAESVGRATNNVAEYGGLVAGLQAALDLDPTASVEVRMDSKLVVEQMSGRWKIKHPDMQKLAVQARDIARQLGPVRYTWVPRAQNGAADALANSAMDGKPVRRDLAAEPVVVEDDVQPAEAVLDPPSTTPTVTTVTHLLRHGRTEHTPERRYSGSSDLPLSQLGRADAEAAARHLAGRGIDVIVSSPLQRTRQTAEAAAAVLGVPVEVDTDLRELDFGAWEGLTADEARQKSPLAYRRWSGATDVRPPGGESIADVSARVARARARILERHAGKTVLLVSHVTPIKLLLAAGLGVGDEIVHRVFLEAASLSTVTWASDGRTTVRLVNDTSHLS
ncbi:bifunctional RNase H/acid phosphatase [Modestobacter roseus]|uniref:Putative phosphoglycerate mutase n=1 Tax=Modestobacter roseus TaxID=1181884 RepID=A0A562IMY1_9ACTN|nr:bifunctional RNase H/acid phosphatase [Modestobacter roseus]MQA32493.1 bifunctional RNase H/acid phosphatase [Modestobacter roseus]TWH72240.1 putative phosphoglycerate mutase [Modestobacter roseus]